MSDLPTLIVPDTVPVLHPDIKTHTVRVDGPLPTVSKCAPGCPHWACRPRPMCAEDRVVLATKCDNRDWISGTEKVCPTCDGGGTVSFATATVAKMSPVTDITGREFVEWLVTVTDVEALP